MANKITNTQYYQDIAAAIRAKNGSSDRYTPSQMAAAIESIPTGGESNDALEYLVFSQYRDEPKLPTYDFSSKSGEVYKAIRPYAFYGHSQLRKITLSPSTKIIGESAFANCTFLTSIPGIEKIETIKTSAFAGCGTLTSIDLSSIKQIEQYAFQSCNKLSSVTFPEDTGDGAITFQSTVFNGCQFEDFILTPKQKIDITAANLLFSTCSKLRRISIPAVVGSQYYSTVAGYCNSLVVHDVSGYGTRWQYYISGLSALRVLTLRNATLLPLTNTAQIINGATQYNQANHNGFFLVPRDLITSYQEATNWSVIYGYGNQFLAIEDYTTDGTTTGELDWDKIDALLA